MSATLRGLRVHLLTCGRAHATELKSALEPALVATGSTLAGHQPLPAIAADVQDALEACSGDADVVLVAIPATLEGPPRLDGELLASLAQPLPGIGEAVRSHLSRTLGAAGWLAPGGGGLHGELVVLVVPDVPEALAGLWTQVLGPIVGVALESLDGDVTVEISSAPAAPPQAAVPVADPDPKGLGVEARQVGQGKAPEPEEEVPLPPWQKALEAYGAQRRPDVWPTLPEAFDRIAAARDVLDRAGEQASVQLPNGVICTIHGFPDLQRPGSKVLLVRDASPLPEVVALHRHPRRVGTLVSGEDGLLPSADLMPDPLSERLTGRTTPHGGFLFALQGDAVLVEREGRVYQFDGRAETDMGRPRQAYASLVLEWSQR